MLVHPQFDPVAIQLGPFGIHWYGIMYLLGFSLFLILGRWRIRRGNPAGWNKSELDDLLFYGVLGVILGGRLGYVFFYKPEYYMADPLAILKLWEGGMAFHGGFIGVLLAMWLFAKKTSRRFFAVTDFIAPLVPLGLAAGRMGNFLNGELWGRVTAPEHFWAMIFPQARNADLHAVNAHPELLNWLQGENLPRHASQLYQFALEGVLLFVILWVYSRKPRQTGQVSALFLLGYGLFRFIAEFAREPDDFLGLLHWGLSMGQWLSIPMILLGAHLYWWSSRPIARH
ncbi:prolipoprotein diacylglyceryl transferase [Chitinilyticum litopenaei]|uniref:prolipoprotein diacylglyceryl transferase n=1 Tax=Chitinilyticum litopenaei TaxID=1121276 RepID=UPI0004037D3D|nr:prolipoprotein diacylglyceryl transferase [Chitinilyticum litopenaei]